MRATIEVALFWLFFSERLSALATLGFERENLTNTTDDYSIDRTKQSRLLASGVVIICYNKRSKELHETRIA